MPFVMTKSSERLNSDIKRDKYDPETGNMIPGNGLRELVLTSLDHTTFEGETTDFKKYVWRGQPDPIKMSWHTMPVFRVQTLAFQNNPGDEENPQSDWNRFLRDFKIDLSGHKDQAIYYEPDITDIRVEDHDSWAFPLWVIERLLDFDGANLIEQAMSEDKVFMPRTKKLTKEQYNAIMKEINKRREQENGKLSRPIEQSESKESGKPAISNSRRK